MKKNVIVFFGIVVLVATAVVFISSCDLDLKGGMFELLNDTGGTIYYRFSTDSAVNSVSYSLSSGAKATLKLSKDGKVYYAWSTSMYGYGIHSGVEEVSGGEVVTIRAY